MAKEANWEDAKDEMLSMYDKNPNRETVGELLQIVHESAFEVTMEMIDEELQEILDNSHGGGNWRRNIMMRQMKFRHPEITNKA
jgi:hypothetical protein